MKDAQMVISIIVWRQIHRREPLHQRWDVCRLTPQSSLCSSSVGLCLHQLPSHSRIFDYPLISSLAPSEIMRTGQQGETGPLGRQQHGESECVRNYWAQTKESVFREKRHRNAPTVVSLLGLIGSQVDLQLNGTTIASSLANVLRRGRGKKGLELGLG